MLEELLDTFFDKDFSPQTFQTFISIIGLVLLCVVAIISISIYLWRSKGEKDGRIFTVTCNGLGEQSEKIQALLKELKANKKEINSALLLIEEIMIRMQGHMEQAVTVRVKRFLGDIKITLSSHGEPYNPFLEDETWNGQSEDYLRGMILYSNRSKLSYSRKNEQNFVTILVHSAGSHALFYTMAAMLAGIAFGFLLKIMPEKAGTFISNGVLSTVQTLFMNTLSLLLAPVLFFSLVTGFSSLSDIHDLGRISGKVLGCFIATTLIAIIISFPLSFTFFENTVSTIPLVAMENLIQNSAASEGFSIKNLLLGIIPKNMVLPISEGNMLQIIFVAAFAGISMMALGDKVSTIRNVFNEANELFLKMMGVAISCMPLVAFSAIGTFVYSSKASSLLMLIVYLLAYIAGSLILFILYSVFILLGARISPIPYIKKASSYLLTPFMLSSSNACIPLTIDFCHKKLGISNKITSFTIPLGATVNMNGSALVAVLTVVFLAKLTGVSLDSAMCLKLGLMSLLFSVGTAGVPNSGIVPLVMLLTVAGIPASSLGILLGVFSIIDRLATAANVNGDIATSILVAKSEKELDEKVYYSNEAGNTAK